MQRFQVQVQATLINSKATGEKPAVTAEALAELIGKAILPLLEERTFSTGSTGFFASAKVSV